MAAIIPGMTDSTTLMKVLIALSDGEIIASKNLHIFLHASESCVHRLLYGLTKNGVTKPYWLKEDVWAKNLSATAGDTIGFDETNRLYPFFDSAAYQSPKSFGDLLCRLFEACCESCQGNQRDAIFEIVVGCLKEEEIEGKYIAAVNAMKESSFTKLFNTMIGWAIEASPKAKAKTKAQTKADAPAEPEPIDPRLQEFINLRATPLINVDFLDDAAQCEEALTAIDTALNYLWENRAYLCHALPELDESDANYVPISRCIFGDNPGEEPLLYAQLLQRKNEILAQYQQFSDGEGFLKEKKELLFNQALSNADRIIRIANTHSINEKVLSKGSMITESLLKEAYLDKIDLYCNLATEIPCACEEDLIATRLSPAVCELHSAAALTGGADLTTEIAAIHNAFFNPSLGLGKKLGRDFTERAKEAVGWEKLLAALKALGKPAVRRPRQEDDFSEVFSPVFSSEYDSVIGQYNKNIVNLVLTTSQLLASGHIPLLQLPQITDNNNFFKQLEDPAFKQLCQNGLIALSAYTGKTVMRRPKDYILSCLNNDSFRFSATGWFNHEDESIRSGCRKAMISALEKGYSIRNFARYFPAEALDEMERLYSGYRQVNEAFLPSHISLYHQDPKVRTAAQPWATYPQQTLPELVGRRIGELIEDDMNCPMPGRSDLLLCMERLQQEALKKGCFTRSDYENLITRRRGSEDSRTLTNFSQLVNYCYNLSNGRRSCNLVYSVEENEALRLHTARPGEISCLSRGALAIRYVYEQHKSSSQNTGLTYSDLSKMVYNIRDRMKDEVLEAQNMAYQLGKDTGLGYEQIAPGRVIVSDMTVAVSQGENINVSIEPKKDAVKEGIELNG